MNPETAHVITGQLHRVRRGREQGFTAEASSAPRRRPARVAVMLALAHQIQRAIDRGEVRDQAEVARRLGFTRARLTYLMDLTLLAPDIQERLLALEAVEGNEPVRERSLRDVARTGQWVEQRAIWRTRRRPPPQSHEVRTPL